MRKLAACILLSSLLFTGCAGGQGLSPIKKPIQAIDFTLVDTQSLAFNDNMPLKEWYLAHYKTKGKYSLNLGEYTYILVSLGEKRSGGYSMEVIDLAGTDKIILTTQAKEPSPEQVKVMMINYPHLLIAIPFDSRNIIWENTISKHHSF